MSQCRPTDTVEFTEDTVVEDKNKDKEGLLAALQAERTKRQEFEEKLANLQQQPPSQPPTEEPVQEEVDWDKLFPKEQPPPQQTQPQPHPQPAATPQPDQLNQFLTWFDDQMEGSEPWQKWQAVATAFGILRSQEQQLESEAKSIIPDYDKLNINDVPPAIIQRVTQNPNLLKAIIAKARTPQNQTPASQPTTTTTTTTDTTDALDDFQKGLIEKGRKMERDRITQQGNIAGMTGESASSGGNTPVEEEAIQLDADSVAFFRARGLTDEQIQARSKKLLENRRVKGFFEGGTY